MRCLVTAGPTYEPLDNVRRLTNFSTGQLGSELAQFLAARGHEVTLFLGEHATYRRELQTQAMELFTTTTDLSERLRKAAERPIDAVFHAAAVSDFRFGKVWLRSEHDALNEISSGKISTRQGTLLAELIPTPKIISQLRFWFPSSRLVGWKFEVEGDRAGVIELARTQISECRTDACIANGPAYGTGFGLVMPKLETVHLDDKLALFEMLANFARASGR